MDWQKFIVPGVFTLVLNSLLIPLFFLLIKRRYEKQNRLFEVRFSEYKKYLQTIDEIGQASRLDFDNVLGGRTDRQDRH